jgi:hypothetical protein
MKNTLLLISALSLASYAKSIVKDHRFGLLGAAVTDGNPQNDNWKVINTNAGGGQSVYLNSEEVVGRSHGSYMDKYDVYLRTGNKLSQVFIGLTKDRTYLMRIRVRANPECDDAQILTFGVDELPGGETKSTIRSDSDDFSKGVYHQMSFVATADVVEIFVQSAGETIGDCKGPLIREVLLNRIS